MWTFVQPAKVSRAAPLERNSPGFAWISAPGSRTSSRFDAPLRGVTIHGDGILSTTSRATPDVSAAWSGAVESAGSNPHHEARASVQVPARTCATRSGRASAEAVNAPTRAHSGRMIFFMLRRIAHRLRFGKQKGLVKTAGKLLQ